MNKDQIDHQKEFEEILKMDLPTFSKLFLKVIDETGKLKPFIFNPAQELVHSKIEKQLQEKGYVRALIPKARKMGVSTYIAARNFHKLIITTNLRCLVLSTSDQDSKVLFDKYKIFYKHLPSWLKPNTEGFSNTDIMFSTGSSLRSIAAGSKGSARGDTAQLLHASEISSWPDQGATIAGALSTVALVPGTELIIESTAKGRGDEYYRMWSNAVREESVYIPIFLPWNLDPRYVLPPSKNFTLTLEEYDYAQRYKLTLPQMMWRRMMISDKGEFLFAQEFPLTPSDCFNVNDVDALISGELVQAARKTSKDSLGDQSHAPLILGVDIAAYGSDKTVFCWRKGRELIKFEEYFQVSHDQILQRLKLIIEKENPQRINIDKTGGYGQTIIDMLRQDGFDNVRGIGFKERAPEDGKYANMRAYMYIQVKEWLEDEPVKIPDDEVGDKLEGDLTSLMYKFDNKTRLQLEDKREMKKRLGHSPDYGDAFALTFATKVANVMNNTAFRNKLINIKKRRNPYL